MPELDPDAEPQSIPAATLEPTGSPSAPRRRPVSKPRGQSADGVNADGVNAEPVKPGRRRSRKTVASDGPMVDEGTPPPPRTRSKKSAPKDAKADTLSESDGLPVGAVDAAPFTDTLAAAFLYVPEPESELREEPNAELHTELHAELHPEPVADWDSNAPSATEPEYEDEPAVDLPFIIDIPREGPAMEASPAEDSGDRVVAFASRRLGPPGEWVDQVLEQSKAPISQRPPRPRPQPARSVSKSLGKSPAKPAPKAPKIAATRPVASASATKIRPDSAAVTRWWLLMPVLLVLAVVFPGSRLVRKHAPVPVGVLGKWTTAFWLYEHQTIEIKPDTIVATLDDSDEGRFPITKVETAEADRELAVTITYQNARGDEKVIDFVADRGPTTALRFRSHAGLVWVKVK
jgi:hypothetical protein